jgi:hypothetical protein
MLVIPQLESFEGLDIFNVIQNFAEVFNNM